MSLSQLSKPAFSKTTTKQTRVILSLFFCLFLFYIFFSLTFFFFVPSLWENQIQSIWLPFILKSSTVISSSSFLSSLSSLFSLGTKQNFEPYFNYHNQATTTPTTISTQTHKINLQTPKSTTTMTSYNQPNPNLPSSTIYNH